MIEIRNLTYYYEGNQEGILDLNLEIFPGEKLGIIGANGSGKSTFFKCMSGILSPHSGEIILNNQVLSLKDLRKKCGFVFQEADHQIIGTTVKQEVCIGLMNQHFPKSEMERRSRFALDYMGLSGYEDRLCFQLSGGEKKRLSIADMIAMEHEILLLDEPTIALDYPHLCLLKESLDKLHNDHKTLCISSHDMDFLYEWADRLIVFENGHCLGSGRPQEIFQNMNIIQKAQVAMPKVVELYHRLFGFDHFLSFTLPKDMKELIKMIQNLKGE